MALTKVSTDGVKDDAITKSKIPANQIEASELADNAVDTNAIADQAVALSKLPHGTSSNDGKFLRANNGADPTFETVTGTTINNNADNRILTGTGSTNTIQGESQLLFDSNGLLYIQAPDGGNRYFFGETGNNQSAQLSLYNSSDEQKVRIAAGDGSSEAATFFNGGKVGIGTSSPAYKLHLNESTSGNNYVHFTNSSTGTSGSDGAQVGIDGNERLILWQAENNDIRFATNNTERMRLLAGGGLTFNGDTSTNNALDDYEEGTWTPAFTASAGSSATTDVNAASYTKIGNQVFVICYISVNSETNSDGGLWMVSGLPFTAKSNNHYFPISVGYWNSLEHSMTYLTGTVQPNETNILFRGIPSGTQSQTTNLSYSTYSQQGAGVILSATYLVA